MAIRPVKRRSLSSLNGDPSLLKARIRPTEIITRINKVFGSRNWHAWLEARGTILVTELLVRGHVGRARISPDLLRGESEVTVHCLGVPENEREQLIARIQQCLGPEIRVVRRKGVEGSNPIPYVATRPLQESDTQGGAVLQPADLERFFRNHLPALVLHRGVYSGSYYVMIGQGTGTIPLAEIVRFPYPGAARRIGGEYWLKTYRGAPTLLAKQLQGALYILIHNRGYNPRTLEPY